VDISADPEEEFVPLGLGATFKFTPESRYEQLTKDSRQVKAITKYELHDLPVYYQFYNPWSVPFTQRVPVAGYESPEGTPELGVRVAPAADVRNCLASADCPSLQLGDLKALATAPALGWPLQTFVADELLGCREGSQFESIQDDRIERMFYRRTGAISAAISIAIEAPGAVA
jgi:hypothetical protein